MRRVLLLMLVGCAEPASIPVEDVDTAFVDADCQWRVRCGVYGSVDECIAAQFTPSGSYAAAVASGLTRYDGEAAASCVALYDTLSCDLRDPVADFSVCAGIYRGIRPLDAACKLDIECSSGNCGGPF